VWAKRASDGQMIHCLISILLFNDFFFFHFFNFHFFIFKLYTRVAEEGSGSMGWILTSAVDS
jgi:hypothetical protein